MKRYRQSGGFTLIETVIVLCIVSVLVRIAIPAYAAIRRDSIASQAVGDFNVVRSATIAQFEATGRYPADAPSGFVPAGMAAYLPRDFSFARREYELDWQNYVVADTTTSGAVPGQILALTVTAHDPQMGLTVLSHLGANCTHWSVDESHTFVIQSSLESPH